MIGRFLSNAFDSNISLKRLSVCTVTMIYVRGYSMHHGGVGGYSMCTCCNQ